MYTRVQQREHPGQASTSKRSGTRRRWQASDFALEQTETCAAVPATGRSGRSSHLRRTKQQSAARNRMGQLEQVHSKRCVVPQLMVVLRLVEKNLLLVSSPCKTAAESLSSQIGLYRALSGHEIEERPLTSWLRTRSKKLALRDAAAGTNPATQRKIRCLLQTCSSDNQK